jgi:hypothetical protein
MTGLSLIFRTLEPDTTTRIFACRRPRLFRRLQQFKLGTAGGKGVETTVEMRECLRGVFVADLPQPKKDPVCSASQLHNVAASDLRSATSRIVRAKKNLIGCHRAGGSLPRRTRHKFDAYCGGMVPRRAAAGPDSISGKMVPPADRNHWLSSSLSAFLGAGLTGVAAGFAFGDLGPLLAFLLAILADHLDHLGKMAGMLGID